MHLSVLAFFHPVHLLAVKEMLHQTLKLMKNVTHSSTPCNAQFHLFRGDLSVANLHTQIQIQIQIHWCYKPAQIKKQPTDVKDFAILFCDD